MAAVPNAGVPSRAAVVVDAVAFGSGCQDGRATWLGASAAAAPVAVGCVRRPEAAAAAAS